MFQLSSILIENGLIVTVDEDSRVLNGSVLIENGKIKEVGDVEKDDFDNKIDAEGKVIIPGLVPGITKPYQIFLRSPPLKVDYPSHQLQKFNRINWPFDEVLTNEDVENGTKAFSLNMLKSGATFLPVIHSSQGSIGKSLDSVSRALNSINIRGMVGFEASERNTMAEGARGMRENVRFLENLEGKSSRDILVGGMVGLSSSMVVSDELLRHAKRVSNRFDVPLFLNSFDSEAESHHNLENYGKYTIERFRDAGVLSSKAIIYGNSFAENELDMIERSGASMVINPFNSIKNNGMIPPIGEFLNREITFAVSSEGNSYDMFETMKFFNTISKGVKNDLNFLSPDKILEIFTRKASRIYNLEDKIGSIEKGKLADLVILDGENLSNPLRRDNVLDQIINSFRSRHVETVIIGGEIVMKNHNIKTLNEKRAMNNSRNSARNVWKKFEKTKR